MLNKVMKLNLIILINYVTVYYYIYYESEL